jgi:hypothetical protein
VFAKLELMLKDAEAPVVADASASRVELDEIEELRRFSAELQEPEEPEPMSFTIT